MVEGQIKAGVRSHYLDRRKVTPTKSNKVPPKGTVTNSSNDNSVLKNAVDVDVITVEDVSDDKDVTSRSDIFADVLRSNDNFSNPRRLLSQAIYPEVDRNLTSFKKLTSGVSIPTDPITVTTLPPQSVLLEIEEELKKIKSVKVAFQFPNYGIFDREGIRVLGRFHSMKSLRRQVQFEETWLKQAFKNVKFEREVTEALLDRWNKDGNFLASYGNYHITSQSLSLLAGERYLSDEVINFLIWKYCDRANEAETQTSLKILLPSFLSTGVVLRNAIERSLIYDMERVKHMFLPVHINESHWGLAVFSVSDKTVFRRWLPLPDTRRPDAEL